MKKLFLATFALLAFASASPAQDVLFRWGQADDPNECNFSAFSDKAGNVIERGVPAKAGQCSARTGAGSTDFGLMMVRFRDSSGAQQTYGDIWMRGWVYFHQNYPVPCCGSILISPHLWRFHGPKWEFQRDFSTVQGQDVVRDHYSGLTPEIVRYYPNTFHFASAERKGRWQCWEIRTRLNTPGQADGVSEFYADGSLVGRFEGLDIRGGSTLGIGAVNVQSNIAKPADAGVPPDMWWLVDDIVISTARVGCGEVAPEPVPDPDPEPDPEPEPTPEPDPDPQEPPASVASLAASVDVQAVTFTAEPSVGATLYNWAGGPNSGTAGAPWESATTTEPQHAIPNPGAGSHWVCVRAGNEAGFSGNRCISYSVAEVAPEPEPEPEPDPEPEPEPEPEPDPEPSELELKVAALEGKVETLSAELAAEKQRADVLEQALADLKAELAALIDRLLKALQPTE